MNGLAGILSDQGRLEESRQLYDEILAIRRRVQGPEHPHTLATMYNLARVLHKEGLDAEAGKLFRETLQLQQRVLGPESPKTLSTMTGLAVVLQAQEELEEAFNLYEAALRLKRRVLGPEHPQTLTAMYNLANVMQEQGRLEEARQLHEETVQFTRRIRGPGHPETLRALNALAWLLATAADPTLRNPPRAVELAKEVVQHASRAADKWNTLGVAYYRAGDCNNAIAALEKAEELAPGRFLGSNALFLAMAHWQLGQQEQAQTCYDRAVGWIEKNKRSEPEILKFRAEAAQLLGIPPTNQPSKNGK
jgi:tetratricopeptide (TPR) repeat protein